MAPAMTRLPLDGEIALVSTLCRDLGLGEVTPVVLKAAHHTTVLVSPLKVVARVQSSEPLAVAHRLAVREIAVARYLAKQDAPTLAPLEDLAGPHVVGGVVVTFWPYLSHVRSSDDGDAAAAATSLDVVHRALLDYGGTLPPYTDALDHCWEVLTDDAACSALGKDDRDVLTSQFLRLRHLVEGATGSWAPLHGDAHLGNFLLAGGRPVWVDFEDACVGPREYDIACLPPAAWRLFENADRALIQQYADLRSVCVAVWCWADLSRSNEVTEAAEYHLRRVRDLAT